MTIIKHPVYFRDEDLNRFVQDNFQVTFNTCGVEDVSVALKVADIILFGEVHRDSDRRLHNRVIEQVYKYDTGILVENGSNILFSPGEGLPNQLKFIDRNMASELHINGWDHSEAQSLMDQAFETFCSHLTKSDRFAQDEHERFLQIAEKFLEIPAERTPEALFKIIKPVISLLAHNASIADSLGLSQLVNDTARMKEIQQFWAFSREGMLARTESLITTLARADRCFQRVIAIAGKAHFQNFVNESVNPEINGIFDECMQKLEASFQGKKVLILMTQGDDVIDETLIGDSESLRLRRKLESYQSNRSVQKAQRKFILKLLESDLEPCVIQEQLRRFFYEGLKESHPLLMDSDQA